MLYLKILAKVSLIPKNMIKPKLFGLKYLNQAFSLATASIRKYPVLLLPFVAFSVLELLALLIIYISPRQPFVVLLGPPIRSIWGETFLHFPNNFLLTHKLMSLARMFMAVVFGSLLTGTTVYMVADAYHNKAPKLKDAFGKALKKYIYLFIVTFIVTATFYFSAKFLLGTIARYFAVGHVRLIWLGAQWWLGPMLPVLNFLLALGIQSVLIYMIPLIVYENNGIIKAAYRTFVVFYRLFFPTVVIIFSLMLCYVPITILKHSTPFLINRVFPEFVLVVVFLGILVGNFIVDALITITTATLYLYYRDHPLKK